jgi:hypothetical protein
MGYWESERLPRLIRNLFLGVAAVAAGILATGLLLVLIWAVMLGGQSLGLWHIHIEDH